MKQSSQRVAKRPKRLNGIHFDKSWSSTGRLRRINEELRSRLNDDDSYAGGSV